jgi:hypothetical protein
VKRDRQTRRRWLIALALAGSVVLILLLGLLSVVPFRSETAREKIVAVLADRLNSDVQLDSLQFRVLPSLRAEGSGLVIKQKGRDGVPPLISVRSFSVEGGLLGVYRKHVSTVTLDGLEISIPPNDKDKEDDDSDDVAVAKPAFVIDNLFTKDASLAILRRDPNKAPRVWAIHDLHMQSVSFDRAMPFDATLTNAIPPGEITTQGRFGPWRSLHPGDTPLDGDFTFEKADLGVFEGISGILSAKGTFGGKLERIDIHGDTVTPEFTLTSVGHAIPLHATYHAVVDGTNGDTFLEQIDASWRNTALVAKGSVTDAPGAPGRVVDLNVEMNGARLEDLLWLAVKAPKPPMSGALTLTTRMVLPPGKIDVVKKLQLDGSFTLNAARFTDFDVQRKIEELSHRSRGQTEPTARQPVTSDFAGSFKLANGSLALPRVAFGVPGSLVRLSGHYGLISEEIDFTGTLHMDAKISETVTGFKSILLKMIDPLFKDENGGSVIPIRISGTRGNPVFGLDKGRIFKK